MGDASANDRPGACLDNEVPSDTRDQAAAVSVELRRDKRRRTLRRIAILYLCFLVTFSWGMLAGHYEWFPFFLLRDIEDFVQYSNGIEVGAVDKLASDVGGTPFRFLYPYVFASAPDWQTLEIPGLNARRSRPLMRLTDDAPRRYRVIIGAFDFEKTFWGAVLIDPQGKVVHTWRLSTDELPESTEPSYRKNLYGSNILPDGSIIFLMQETGGGIVRVDYQGKVVWTLPGRFHHTVSLTDDGGFWTLEGNQSDFDPVLTLVDAETGKVRQRINMADVRAANPNTHIFDLQRAQNTEHSVHANDVKPLPQRLENAFPGFKAGDLLISYNTTNLLFVVDPVNLKVKWWRSGLWDRQHDPNWESDGSISVLSNNTREVERGTRHHSDIVSVEPGSLDTRILLHGKDYEFLCMINGRHRLTDAGTLLITSSTQGRVFEVDSAGRVVFEFVNLYDAKKQLSLHVSNAMYFGDESFDPIQFAQHRGF